MSRTLFVKMMFPAVARMEPSHKKENSWQSILDLMVGSRDADSSLLTLSYI